MDPVATGLDRLVAEDARRLRGRRVGLLAHPASVDRRLRHAVPLLAAALGRDLRVLFGPQHGLRGETQDNMVEWRSYRDPATRLPVHSLYGEHRQPTPEMLADLDVLVVDLQDVGARYYTFAWTLLLCLEACAKAGKQVLVLDRPNPLGRAVEGNVLDPAWRSFVGLAPVPMRHGLTLGELARWLRAHGGLDVDLDVVPLGNWRGDRYFEATGLPWVLPSPNLPTVDSAVVYPGACLFEGTSLSEGRGTTRPFEIVGAPFVDPERLVESMARHDLPGAVLRPLHFLPTFQKHAGRLCGGVQVHVTERNRFRPVLAYLALLVEIRRLWPADFAWKEPPYEYEREKLPIDILAGGPALREAVERGDDPRAVADSWQAEAGAFAAAAAAARLYA
ncbi:MAG TPA: DUF1343 domain-containing protein [Candidatus Krumholzibacteria bacterium]|nr:DUF1343 domain-containing protein [Candidatus Krumholzibacteria bacterium]HPD72586.1 DUF1343 domain-containing protein [Candidatus Krumholzibacteria bacterium]HRY40482.1 DUF1343 domain-containing protein [Candidatus Krumholzibacteria bacterium]